MLTDKSILCFAPEPWDTMWRSRQQIMSRLAARNKVMFVEPRQYFRPVAERLWRREIALDDLRVPLVRSIADGLHVFRPPLFAPISERFPLSNATEFTRNFLLHRAMKRLGFSSPILWMERPDVWDEMGKHGEVAIVYRVTDEYTAFVGLSQDGVHRVQVRERAILCRADLVLVASASLLTAKKSFNPNTHLLPHGVNYEAFAGFAGKGLSTPDDAVGLRRPIIGYSGLVGARLDLRLLGEVATSFPWCTLALVGEVNPLCCEEDLRQLQTLENVVFLGRKPAREVPGYVNAFDVCLIPYQINNEEARNANPLKLLEYLAAGKPVVSVNVPAIRAFSGVVRVGDDSRSFLEAVGMALKDDDDHAVARRREIAAAHSWDQIVEHLGDLVEMALPSKNGVATGSDSA